MAIFLLGIWRTSNGVFLRRWPDHDLCGHWDLWNRGVGNNRPPPHDRGYHLGGKYGYFREIILRRGALPLGGSGMGGGA